MSIVVCSTQTPLYLFHFSCPSPTFIIQEFLQVLSGEGQIMANCSMLENRLGITAFYSIVVRCISLKRC